MIVFVGIFRKEYPWTISGHHWVIFYKKIIYIFFLFSFPAQCYLYNRPGIYIGYITHVSFPLFKVDCLAIKAYIFKKKYIRIFPLPRKIPKILNLELNTIVLSSVPSDNIFRYFPGNILYISICVKHAGHQKLQIGSHEWRDATGPLLLAWFKFRLTRCIQGCKNRFTLSRRSNRARAKIMFREWSNKILCILKFNPEFGPWTWNSRVQIRTNAEILGYFCWTRVFYPVPRSISSGIIFTSF